MIYDGVMIEMQQDPSVGEADDRVGLESVGPNPQNEADSSKTWLFKKAQNDKRFERILKYAQQVRKNNLLLLETDDGEGDEVNDIAQLVRIIAQEGQLVNILEIISESQNILKDYGENDQSIREIIQEAIRSLIHQIEADQKQVPSLDTPLRDFLESVQLDPNNKKWAKDALIYLEQMLNLVQNSQNEPLDELVDKLENYS